MAHSADFQLNLSLFLAKLFLWGIDTSFCRGGGGAGIVGSISIRENACI